MEDIRPRPVNLRFIPSPCVDEYTIAVVKYERNAGKVSYQTYTTKAGEHEDVTTMTDPIYMVQVTEQNASYASDWHETWL